MRRPAKPEPRCGACDTLAPPGETLAMCEDCGEPTCARHLERLHQAGEPAYVCTVCADEACSADPLLTLYRERPGAMEVVG